MKKVTASEARRAWFRLLDEAAAGEVIVVERRGRRLVLRREETARAARGRSRTAYRALLAGPRVDEADRWSWTWGPDRGLRPVRRARR